MARRRARPQESEAKPVPTTPEPVKPPVVVVKVSVAPQFVPRRPDYRCTRCGRGGCTIKTSRGGVAWLTCSALCTDEDGSVWFKLPVGN
jgi:hypothetical protein